jgi:hypothetical protein
MWDIFKDANSNKNKTICIGIRKFKVSDKFSFAADDSLEQACNAQKEACFSICSSRR